MYKIIRPNKQANGADTLLLNDYAKLIFQCVPKDGTNCTERAWVQLKGTCPDKPEYLGIFTNEAVHNIGVKQGDLVEFTAADVTAILPREYSESDVLLAFEESRKNQTPNDHTHIIFDR